VTVRFAMSINSTVRSAIGFSVGVHFRVEKGLEVLKKSDLASVSKEGTEGQT
jgi:hypothetical protein